MSGLTESDVESYVRARRAVQRHGDLSAPAELPSYKVGGLHAEEGERRRIWWARERDHLVGYVGVALPTAANREPAQFILEVRPDHRGHGIGRELVRSVAGAARWEGRSQLWYRPRR